MELELELESLHLFVLACTVIAILYADHEGLSYVRGKKAVLNARSVQYTHRFVWVGLIGMILTGVALILPAWEYWLNDSTLYVKMGFVLMLVINSFFIDALSPVATERPFHELDTDTRRTLLVSGALSGIGWVGAAVIGFFFL